MLTFLELSLYLQAIDMEQPLSDRTGTRAKSKCRS